MLRMMCTQEGARAGRGQSSMHTERSGLHAVVVVACCRYDAYMTGAVFACLLRLHEASQAEALPRDQSTGDGFSWSCMHPPLGSSALPAACRALRCSVGRCRGVPAPSRQRLGSVSALLTLRTMCCPAGPSRPAPAAADGAASSGGLSVRDIVQEAEQPVCSTQQPGFSGVQVRG